MDNHRTIVGLEDKILCSEEIGDFPSPEKALDCHKQLGCLGKLRRVFQIHSLDDLQCNGCTQWTSLANQGGVLLAVVCNELLDTGVPLGRQEWLVVPVVLGPQMTEDRPERCRVALVVLHELGQKHCHRNESHRQVVKLPESIKLVVMRLRRLHARFGLDELLRILDRPLQRSSPL